MKIKQKIHLKKEFFKTDSLLKQLSLSTVCSEALCPNRHECFSKKVATFLALGNVCTRHCSFCNIGSHKKKLLPPDPEEINKIVQTAKILNLSHIVITMVCRDDLKDGGAHHLASILHTIKRELPKTTSEILTGDFEGKIENLQVVLNWEPYYL